MTGSESICREGTHSELELSVPPIDDAAIGAYVQRFAEEAPGTIALRYLGVEFSYAQLNVYANQFANALLELGVRRGDAIGMYLAPMPQYFIALAAASKLGSKAHPLSPLLEPYELVERTEELGISLLLALDTLASTSLVSKNRLPKCLETVVVTTGLDHLAPGETCLPELPLVAVYDYLGLLSRHPSILSWPAHQA